MVVVLASVASPVEERVVTVVAKAFSPARLLKLLTERVEAVALVVVRLAVVARPVVERVLTVVERAFNDPVEDKDEPVTAPAETSAKVA